MANINIQQIFQIISFLQNQYYMYMYDVKVMPIGYPRGFIPTAEKLAPPYKILSFMLGKGWTCNPEASITDHNYSKQ